MADEPKKNGFQPKKKAEGDVVEFPNCKHHYYKDKDGQLRRRIEWNRKAK